jgi:DNA-binding MarR family transcriptional regulator
VYKNTSVTTEPSSQHDSRLSEAVCLALYTSLHAVLQLYRDLLSPWGLTYQQLLVLALLWENGAVSPGQIAQTLVLDSSSVAGLLNRMERAGLVERETDRRDRRRVLVRASEQGLAARDQLGWLQECMTSAIDLDPATAHGLVTRLHELRATVAAFPRPDPSPAAA